MSDLTKAYLAQIERLLEKHIPEPRRSEMLAELRSHLHLAAKDFLELGVSQEDAWHDAIRNLGSAQVVAGDLIRQYRGYDRRPAWQLALLPVTALLIVTLGTISLPLLWWTRISQHFVLMDGGLIVLGCFAFAVWRSRRWLVGPVLLISAALGFLPLICSAFNTSFWTVGGIEQPISRSSLTFHRLNQKSRLERLQQDLFYARLAMDSARSGTQMPRRFGHFPVPGAVRVQTVGWMPGAVLPASINRGTFYALTGSDYLTEGAVADIWRSEGASTVQSLKTQIAETKRAVDDPSLVGYRATAYFLTSALLSLATLAIHAGVLWGVNWLVLFLSIAWRNRLNRKDPFLA